MPNGNDSKEYGRHKYANHGGTSDCEHGCGCWMGPSRSGGPVGLDPFEKCPKNPKDGKLLGGDADYKYVVTERISELKSRLYRAEHRLNQVSPDKIELSEKLDSVKSELAEKNRLLGEIRHLVETDT